MFKKNWFAIYLWALLLVLALLVLLVLASCGKRADLYLPDEIEIQETQTQEAQS